MGHVEGKQLIAMSICSTHREGTTRDGERLDNARLSAPTVVAFEAVYSDEASVPRKVRTRAIWWERGPVSLVVVHSLEPRDPVRMAVHQRGSVGSKHPLPYTKRDGKVDSFIETTVKPRDDIPNTTPHFPSDLIHRNAGTDHPSPTHFAHLVDRSDDEVGLERHRVDRNHANRLRTINHLRIEHQLQ